MSENDDRKPGVRDPGKIARRAIIVAMLIAFTVGCARFAPGWVVRLFGPPTVSMSEVYEADENGPSFDHSLFDSILKSHVNDNGGVDYESLGESPEPLRNYVASLAQAPFAELGRDEKLALLINAYNAFTLDLIVEWMDQGITSIRDIPADKRWTDARWNIGGNIWSLSEIENEQMRPNFREPNIHWALVCAAVGCPPLRPEAYVAERIAGQLDDQAHIVHTNDSRWLGLDTEAGKVHLTALYNWYGGDFEQVSGSVLEHVAKYAPSVAAEIEAGRSPDTVWLDYDWTLNNQENLD